MIKLWDISTDTSTMSMSGGQSQDYEVKAVKFSPLRQCIFAACYNNGKIHIWDLRNNREPISVITSSLKQCLTLDWHPTQENILASGAMDHLVKVWNIEEAHHTNQAALTIQTTEGVSRC